MQSWTWSHQVTQTGLVTVFPDGCRDVIVMQRPGERPVISLTSIDLSARAVTLIAGTTLTGFRLEPGAVVTPAQLRAIAARRHEMVEILAQSDCDTAIAESIRALAQPFSAVARVARGQGVSVHSLQRRFQRQGLPGPDFWRLLARARRAAALLSGPLPLVAVAADCGYADQPHLTHAFQHWFGLTPGQARRRPDVLAQITQPGLGA